MPQIVNPDIGQGTARTEWEPPIAEIERPGPGAVWEDERSVLAAVDPFQHFERLAVEPDRLCSSFAIRQQKSRRLQPPPAEIDYLAHTSAGKQQ